MRCSVTTRQVVIPIMHYTICHLQKKHMSANKPLYMTIIGLEEAFDQVPRDVILKDVRSRESVAKSLILEWMFIRALPEFEFGVDVYQGFVLNSLLLIIV